MSESQIRNALRDKFGPRRYRITRFGDVHAYGLVPGTSVLGWWLFCYIEDIEHWI